MKSWLTYIEEKETSFKDVSDWINSLDLSGRSPRGMKNQMKIVSTMKWAVDHIEKWGNNDKSYIQMSIDDFNKLTQQERDKIYKSLGKDNNEFEFKGKYATYHKKDKGSQAKFNKAVKELESFFATFKGIYKKGLKNLVIHFVSAKDLKAKATYRTTHDIIYIKLHNMNKLSDEYGSLKYVILHELFHRMMNKKFIKPNFEIDSYEWITTPYSQVETFGTSEEKGAEIFAMSFFPVKYKQYQDKINKFMEKLK